MAHELSFDEATGVYEAAYVGTDKDVWHKLGQYVPVEEATTARMMQESGLVYSIEQAPVQYVVNGEIKTDEDKIVQYRSDNGVSLGVVGAGFETSQPAQIFELMDQIKNEIGAEWDAAFALFGGKKLVCQLKLDAPALEIIKGDLSSSYLTFACACDGTMPRSIWLSEIRSVCNNMLSYSFNKAQKDKLSRLFRQSHRTAFDASLLKEAVYMTQEARQQQAEILRSMSAVKLDISEAKAVIASIMGKPAAQRDKTKEQTVKLTRPETDVIALFTGEAKGYEFAGETIYGLLNSVTEYVDHHYGRSQDARLNSALMGPNALLKEKAFSTLADITSGAIDLSSLKARELVFA